MHFWEQIGDSTKLSVALWCHRRGKISLKPIISDNDNNKYESREGYY